MPALKIAILGCRGIPNCYGGFEQLAQHLAEGLVKDGFAVSVYNSHRHPYKASSWQGVNIIHCYDPEYMIGTAGQFIYDLNCIRNARRQQFDVLLFLGYTSSSIWGRWFPKRSVIISNMDGMEWQRSKYPKPVKRFLQYAEKLATRYSDHLIADSPVIQAYLKDTYNTESCYIAYGAGILTNTDTALLNPFSVTPGNYYMLMARMEPENNIEMILQGFQQSASTKKILVVGNTGNGFGRKMVKKFGADARVHFTGAVYDAATTHCLRQHCALYFHGHSVGGTNPSLLEAMADKALIAAHENDFNKAVLQQDAFYFSSAGQVQQLIASTINIEQASQKQENNYKKITARYTWPHIIEKYKQLIVNSYNLAKP